MSDTFQIETGHALEALMLARGKVSVVGQLLDTARNGITFATRALGEAERTSRAAIVDPEQHGPNLTLAAETMVEITRRCTQLAHTSASIGAHLNEANQLIEAATAALGRVDRATLTPTETGQLDALQARVDSYAGIVGLAVPIAAAAREHLSWAAQMASSSRPEPAKGHAIADAVERVTQVRVDLGRGGEAGRNLGTVLQRAESVGATATGQADRMHDTARQRLAHSARRDGALTTPFPVRSPAR